MSRRDPNYIQKRMNASSAQGKSDLQYAAIDSKPPSPDYVSSEVENAVPPVVRQALSSPGQPLASDTRAFMEPRFGHNFSQVQVHTDVQAAESAQAVDALAYTVGQDVVFGAKQYAPETTEGKRLLAHELTHVVQQKDEAGNVGTPMELRTPEDAFDQQASTISQTIARGEFLSPQATINESHGGFLIQRQPDDAGATKPSPTPTSTWTSDLITITLASDQPNCFSITTPSSSSPYNDCFPDKTIKAPFCQSVRVPFEVDFYVDRAGAPRPQPFKAPKVSIHFTFVTSSGKVSTDVQKIDPAPRYISPNIPLEPNFGHLFPIGTDVSGTLFVRVELQDVSGVNLVHAESIHFIVVPCA